MHYQVRNTAEGVSYTIHWRSTLLYALFALLFLALLILGITEGSTLLSLLLVIFLLLLSLAGALYRDSWYFHVAEGFAESRWGFGPVVQRRMLLFSEIQRLSVTHFYKGSTTDKSRIGWKRAQSMVLFRILLEAGGERTIVMQSERKSGGSIEAAARKIAAATDLPLSIDRPKDPSLDLRLRDL